VTAAQQIQPELLVVVDTEEEFDWSRPFSRTNTSTRSIVGQGRAHALYDRFGIRPTYVVDYPVTADREAVTYLRSLADSGRAEIGAHLHTWVTPPHDEPVTERNSFQSNLSPELKRKKIECLTLAIQAAFGQRPTIFKAGRYGLGPNTPRFLAEFGYRVDCSILPFHDLSGQGGPDFRRACDQPYWIEGVPDLLEVPVTAGFFGAAAWLGRRFSGLFDDRMSTALHLPGILSRSGLVTRARLTPEGVPSGEQIRLLDALVRSGRRTFSLVYHSPSLVPGNTPYVRSEADLDLFLHRLEEVLRYFRDRLGGRFTTLPEVHARMAAERERSVVPARSHPPEPGHFLPAAPAGRAARG
jgi:hypothetical protein